MKALAPLAWIVVVGALAYQCLRRPTSFWTGVAWVLTLGVLLTAILEAIIRRGRERSFWVGFLVFGWVYMILSFNHWPFEFIEGHLLTTRVFDEVYLAVHPEPPPGAARAAVDTWDLLRHKPMQQDWNLYRGFNQIQFRWAWHSLTALAAGLIGGVVALRLLGPSEVPREQDVSRRIPRFSLAALLTVILVLSAGFAALRIPCGMTLNLVFTALSAMLAWSVLAAILGRGRRQVFWAGFAVFTWPYLIAAYSQFDVRLLTYGWNPAEGYLPSSRLWAELYPVFHREPADQNALFAAWNPGYNRPTRLAAPILYDLNRQYFIQIGHALSGLIVGMLGGVVALRIRVSSARAPRGVTQAGVEPRQAVRPDQPSDEPPLTTRADAEAMSGDSS
jgi:hypothetical protein